jgi:hypothetical protein
MKIKMYILTFFNKYHQTSTVMAVSESLNEVVDMMETLNASIGYAYDGGTSVWDQKATGYFGWKKVLKLEEMTLDQILEKKKMADCDKI